MAAQKEYKRASDIVGDMSPGLDDVEDKELLLYGVRISMRSMRGKETEFVEVDVAPVDDAENISTYHAWSKSLAEKLAQIPDSDMPVLINFTRVRTGSGFRVWTIV